MDLKRELSSLTDRLDELEAAARKLRNQNYADVVKSAKGRVQQLADHPDLHLVQKEMNSNSEELPFNPHAGMPPATKEEAIERMRADDDADPEGTAKMNWPHLFSRAVPQTA